MSGKSSILFLHSSSDLYGGSKIFLLVVTILKESGYKVTVVLSSPGPLVAKLEEKNISVHLVRLGIFRRKYFNLSGIINRLIVMILAYSKLRRLIEQEEVDIIYSNTIGVFIGGILAKRLGHKHIFHIHEIIERPKWFVSFVGNYIKYFSNAAIVVSKATRDCWKRYAPKHGLHLVYNGIDYVPYQDSNKHLRAELNFKDEDIIIGMVARVSPWKGQAYFLEIASRLKRQYHNVKFLMAGDPFSGNEFLLTQLQEQIQDYGLAGSVIDLGYRSDIPEVLNTMDIFILPSILPDPFPTTVLEAMAAGLPVVASAHGGVCEMIKHGEDGLLIPWDDSREAALIMSNLVENKDLRNKIGRMASKKVSAQFSRKSFNEGIIKVVEATNHVLH